MNSMKQEHSDGDLFEFEVANSKIFIKFYVLQCYKPTARKGQLNGRSIV